MLPVIAAVDGFRRADFLLGATPLERQPRLSESLGIELLVKRDDLTGLAFGGNKVRKLEFYFGKAQAANADTVLITGAVQSNYTRVTAACAARLGMGCDVQLEERVPNVDATYRSSGNVLVEELLGATLHSYPVGEDEDGADRRLGEIAADLAAQGKRPFVIPLGANNPPLGALVMSAAPASCSINAATSIMSLCLREAGRLTPDFCSVCARTVGPARCPVSACVARRKSKPPASPDTARRLPPCSTSPIRVGRTTFNCTTTCSRPATAS